MNVLQLFFYLCTFIGYLHSMQYRFPDKFKFGVATSAYQTEGVWNNSGKGESIWDKITHEKSELIADRSNADITTDSYHKLNEDIEHLKWLGVDFYRFSLSWSRLLPSGYSNRINQEGVWYYNQLIDALIENNITPMVTLNHWDLPQPLQEIGGWPNAVLAKYFEDYARTAFKLFGDRVKIWITFNEPLCQCLFAYGLGIHAPAAHGSGIGEYMCGYTILLAHARVYHMYQQHFKRTQQGKIGIALNGEWAVPKTNSTEDVRTAERLMQFYFGWWAHPIFSKPGNYPKEMIDRVAKISKEQNYPRSRLKPFTEKQVKYIQGTADFFALNYYYPALVQALPNSSFTNQTTPSFNDDVGVEYLNKTEWPEFESPRLNETPSNIRNMLKWIKSEYGDVEIYITENGYPDRGKLHDPERINFIQDYLQKILEAIYEDKCNIVAYTYWSLLDNFEWVYGYTKKFGLFYVNFTDPSRPRLAKDSASAYRSIISTRKIE